MWSITIEINNNLEDKPIDDIDIEYKLYVWDNTWRRKLANLNLVFDINDIV